jgi:hypothetical protein
VATGFHELSDLMLALDPADRLALAAMLIESVEQEPDPEWRRSWTEELRRRTAAADTRQVRGRAWVEIRARLLREVADE